MSNDFDFLDNALAQDDADTNAPNCHGNLCGVLCTLIPLDAHAWIISQWSEEKLVDTVDLEAYQCLERLFTDQKQQFENAPFELELFLPDDETEISTRTQALSDWCEGFLIGLSMGGVKDVEALGADPAEFVKDLLEITQVNNYELDNGEEDEKAYTELVEYIRAGVLLVYEELHIQAAAKQQDSTLLH